MSDLFSFGLQARERLEDVERAIARLERDAQQETLLVEFAAARQAELQRLRTDRETLKALIEAEGL